MQGVLALPVEPDTAIRSGPEPQLIRLDDAASEMHYAAALIETWLRGGLEIGGRRQRVTPGDIAVLYPRRRPDAAVTTLCDRLNGFTRAVLPAGDKPTGTLRDQAVKILPMHSARGLQFRIVLLLWADQLPSTFKSRDDGIDRGLLYVAMTQAEDVLVILHSGSRPMSRSSTAFWERRLRSSKARRPIYHAPRRVRSDPRTLPVYQTQNSPGFRCG
jgi:ATP-dependent exoDNAse (exonuclease V) beta subunit